jgi:hypothetical protein
MPPDGRRRTPTPNGRPAGISHLGPLIAEQVAGLVLIDGAYPIATFMRLMAALYVVGTGAHSGATEEEMRVLRAAAQAEASNKRVSAFATTQPAVFGSTCLGWSHSSLGRSFELSAATRGAG